MKYLFFTPFLLILMSFGVSLSAQSIDLPVTNKLVPHDVLFQGSDEVTVNLKGLVVGDTYHVYVVQDKYNPPVALSSLPIGLAEQSNTYLRGTVGAGVISFCLDALAPKLNGVSIVVGKNLPSSMINNREKVVGDTIEVEENNDIDFLLNTVFRKDTCFALFPGGIQGGRRIRPDGSFLGQTGVFRNGVPTVGIDSGIIVSTGWVQDAVGPNTPAASQNGPVDFFTTMNGLDPDADDLVPPNVDIYDLAVLEFDFIPTTDTISFNYVFFSEQYCATLGGNVANDAFGFILTGPDGIPVNIARLPVSDDIVSPATLNPGSVDAASFLNNTTPAHGDPCVDTPPPPARLAGIGYDGFSTILTARGAVTPCARHTLKIVVLDANDALSDSGVLLEAGSFLAGLVNKPEPNTTAQVDVLQPVEGCDTATIRFTRRTVDEPFINRPLIVKYNIIPFFGAGATEATRTEDPNNTAGADYVLPASPFIIPGGDTSAVLNIPILADADFGEGLEAFIIRYDGTCDCSENADTFWIQDAVNYVVDIGPDLTLCAGEDIELTATPTGGNGNYSFEWPNLADTNRVTYSFTGRDTTINVTATDECGLMGSGSVNIMAPAFSATTVDDYSLCSDPTADVFIDVNGTGPFIISLWVDSNNVVSTTDYQVTGDTTFIFEVNADVTVSAITDLSGCGGAVSQDTSRIRSADVQFTDVVELALCDDPVGAITINTTDGNNNFTFAWTDDAGETTGSRSMLVPGIYEVSIAPISDPSCARLVSYDLRSPAALEVDTFNYTVPSCAGETITLAPIVVGGTGDYSFAWPDSMTTDSLLTIVTQPGLSIYPVIVTDSCGRQASGSVVLNLPTFNVDMSGRYSLCNSGSVAVPYTITGPADTYSVEVRIDSAGMSTSRVLVRPAGASTLVLDYAADITITGITNSSGCTGDTIMGTASVVDPDIRFTALVDSVTCNNGNDGQISLTDAANVPVTYTWSDSGPTTAVRTGLTAGSYTVTITDAADPTCFRDTTILVEEPIALAVAMVLGTATCPFEPDTIGPQVMGGTPPYTYSWPDSMSTDSALAITTLPGTNSYQVEVTDACGSMAFATVSYVFEDVRATVSGTFGVCNAPFFTDVPVTLTGSTGYTFTIRENGSDRTLTVTGDTTLRYTAATTIELIEVLGADGCAGVASGIARVIDADFNVTNAGTNVTCRGGNNGTLDLTVNGDPSAYTYAWERAGLSGPNPTGLAADTFRVRITDNSP
ncbi:MAG: choice-of-anchor L domain-containing protein, partial [Lewinella sp.]